MKKNTSPRAFALRMALTLALILVCSILFASIFASSLRTTHSPRLDRMRNPRAPQATVAGKSRNRPGTPLVFTVSNTNDSGTGSLRQEILDANAMGGGTINFNIGGSGVHTISPL